MEPLFRFVNLLDELAGLLGRDAALLLRSANLADHLDPILIA